MQKNCNFEQFHLLLAVSFANDIVTSHIFCEWVLSGYTSPGSYPYIFYILYYGVSIFHLDHAHRALQTSVLSHDAPQLLQLEHETYVSRSRLKTCITMTS